MWGRSAFRGGVTPATHKAQTQTQRIRQFPFAPLLEVPLLQHAGRPALPVVREGAAVERGAVLGRADGERSVPVHAPAAGRVQRIALMPSVTGAMVPGIYLEPFPGATQEVASGTACDLATATAEDIINAVQAAGIVGLGGAAFPTHAKLRMPPERRVRLLIINGAECEPWLTTDYRVMLEQPADVVLGVRYLLKATGAEAVVLAVEEDGREAGEAVLAAAPEGMSLKASFLPTRYPQGAEKLLIRALLGVEVPAGGLPIDVGALCINVATAAEIGRLLPFGRGIQERVVTITGPGVLDPGNYRMPIGTPLRFALEQVGTAADVTRVFLGGPMMGQPLASLDVPITKGISGFVAFTSAEYRDAGRVQPCIHCGRCVQACPMTLNPCQLGLLARHGEVETMRRDFHLDACFECGCCAYVCPSHIPLVQEFRAAKAELRRLAAHAVTEEKS
ncbi:MAG: electron transport complex subunit RsxC [Gammaproteobacteria bacterium]|nr:MAG: electron transport complex subunit RsxC [Gammaproteobacteria bacterium]